ncbi:hypothetical protein PV327_006469 [Microctonus hyperodae]|uniref:Uncharacterized protein n=1 Tax=Microctonus hyperodae TaxID=165561 RepID=A0AA39KIC8_MICHY|nr:hypothetical protein PV327_006469 [Microctonus hyperodae]
MVYNVRIVVDDDGKYAGVGKLAAARGGRGPKAGTDKELVNALFRANGSVRAASPCSVRGKGSLHNSKTYVPQRNPHRVQEGKREERRGRE